MTARIAQPLPSEAVPLPEAQVDIVECIVGTGRFSEQKGEENVL